MRFGRVLGVAVVLLTGVLLGSPAYAHVELVSSNPSNGAELDTPPGDVVLTFSDPVNPDLSKVGVAIDEQPAKTGEVRIDGATITVPVEGGPGRYRIVYRVVSSDGHRVDNEVRFTVTGPAVSPTPGASEPATVVAPARTTAGATTEPDGRTVTRSWIWLIVGLGGLVVIGALAYVLTVGRKRGEDIPTGGDTTSQSNHDTGDRTD